MSDNDREYFRCTSEGAPGEDRRADDGLQIRPHRSQGRHGGGGRRAAQEGHRRRRPRRRPATTSEGAVASYIHAGGKIGVLVEVNCESDFVARTDDFKELVHDIAMHIAASDPKFVRKEDVTPEAYEREKDIYRAQAARHRQAAQRGREDRGRQDEQVLRGSLPAGAALHQGPDRHASVS